MRTFDELERAFSEWSPFPRDRGAVSMLVVRKPEGARETPQRIELTLEGGVIGDRWADGERKMECQITLMAARVAELIAGPDGVAERIGDNLLVDLDLGEDNLPAGALLRVGTAVVEVTPKPHTGCNKFSARFGQDALRWVNWKSHRARRLRGIHAMVTTAGIVSIGDAIEVVRR